MRTDTMMLAAFGTASTTKGNMASWMHDSTDRDFLDVGYYTRMARIVEDAGFDFLFFDDRLAIPSAYGQSHADAVGLGARSVKLDLVPILGAAAAVTSRIGLGATYSTTYHHPFHVARTFATLDHLSRGRAIWNIVTSLNHDEARNFGYSEHSSPEQRYERAHEFLDVVTGLWETWDEDAIRYDRSTGVFADRDAVSRLDHKGAWYASSGPLPVPRPPQGWPVLLQAGQSGAGMRFAAQWADLTFTNPQDRIRSAEQYAKYKQLAVECGRSSADIHILPFVVVIVGETDDIAAEKAAYVDSLFDPVEQLISLSEIANLDFGMFPLDVPLTDDLVESVTGSKGVLTTYLSGAREHYGADVTPAQLARYVAHKPGARFVGSGPSIADAMAEWFQSQACDGFVISPPYSPGAFADFGRSVVPHLRRAGLVDAPRDAATTFRARHGLARRDSR